MAPTPTPVANACSCGVHALKVNAEEVHSLHL